MLNRTKTNRDLTPSVSSCVTTRGSSRVTTRASSRVAPSACLSSSIKFPVVVFLIELESCGFKILRGLESTCQDAFAFLPPAVLGKQI